MKNIYIFFLCIICTCVSFIFGRWDISLTVASILIEIFFKLLKFISLPIIFLSVLKATFEAYNSKLFPIFQLVIYYTVLTTLLAVFISVILCINFGVPLELDTLQTTCNLNKTNLDILQTTCLLDKIDLLNLIPGSIYEIFIKGNIIIAILLAILLGVSMNKISSEKGIILMKFYDALLELVMHITGYIKYVIVVFFFSGMIILIDDIINLQISYNLFNYILLIIGANLIHAVIVLPILLYYHNISPFSLMKKVYQVLILGFITKSSYATLPSTIECMQNNTKVSKKLINFILPICSTINMNACANFIFTTVYIYSMSYGYEYSIFEVILLMIITIMTAIGNAAVPMGCYFMSVLLLDMINIPGSVVAIILPFYLLLDSLETSVNIWSDITILSVVNKRLNHL